MTIRRRQVLGASLGGLGLSSIAACRSWFDASLEDPDTRSRAKGPEAYSLEAGIRYLNHASIGTIPRLVQRAHAEYLRLCETNPWLYMWGGAWDEARERVRASAAQLLSCAADDIVINRNTTDGFNVLAQGLPLERGDEVLFSSLNHDGASVCWEHHGAPRGVRVRRFEIPARSIPELDETEVIRLHVDAIHDATRVLVLPHIDNMIGLRTPVRAIADAARARGVDFVLVDGAQSAGMLELDVPALGADAYCMSPHKWVQGPKGVGLLYVSQSLRGQLRAQTVTWGKKRWAGSARTLEDYGTRDLPAVLALGDALRYQHAIGVPEQAAERRRLWQALRARIDAEPRYIWRSPKSWELGASLVAIEARGLAAPELGKTLWTEHKTVVRAFGGRALNTLRVSPNTMNTPEDFDALFHALPA